MADMEILYHEDTADEHTSADGVIRNRITVCARRWQEGNYCDVVIESYVVANGVVVAHERECHKGLNRSDAEIQRYAIKLHDKLLNSHPARAIFTLFDDLPVEQTEREAQ